MATSGTVCRKAGLRERVRAREAVIGTFVKTTSPQTVEVLGHSGLDFLVLDAEHAPFGRSALDAAAGAALGAAIPALVRIPDHGASFINTCLDLGAQGVLAPHIRSAEDANRVVDAVKYHRGKRGFSPSGRAGNYGQVGFAEYRQRSDRLSSIWCQIEDAEALNRLDAIAAVEEVDCLFIGPADLALSLGAEGLQDPRLIEAITAIAQAGARHGRAVGIFVANPDQIAGMRKIGISLFVCGSDQGFLLANARQAALSLSGRSGR